jgi:aspartyl-tRNA(Asn)/glutamyl-tRNA(Gln) amidotransferase subunit C
MCVYILFRKFLSLFRHFLRIGYCQEVCCEILQAVSVGTVKNLSSQYIYTHALQVVDAHLGQILVHSPKIKYQEREKGYRMNHIGTREIATERLTLRRFEIEDAENMFYNWANDPEVTKYLTWPAHESVDTTETILKEWISKYDEKDFYQWAIELNDLEQPIGTISAIKTDERVESVEIGYCIGKSFWNNGYMTEALTAIIRFFINEVGAGRVWARHDTENQNSGKVMAAAGMDYEGTLRHAGFNNQGICDEAVYAKVRSAALDEEPEEESPEQQAVTTKVMGEDGVMRNVISDETMEYVGILAKLELSPEEAEAAKKDMADMLDYIDKLEELDTSGIEPMSHVFPVNNVFRDDVVTNGDGSEATLANAPVKKDGGFKVPKTIGE